MTSSLKSNRKHFPVELRLMENHDLRSTCLHLHLQDQTILVSYIPRVKSKKVALIMFPAMRNGKKVSTDEKTKSDMYSCNKSKGSINTIDQMVRAYSMKRRT